MVHDQCCCYFVVIATAKSFFILATSLHLWGAYTVWPESLAGIKFGGLALKGCEFHLADENLADL